MRSFPGDIPGVPKASYSPIRSPTDPEGHFLAPNVCILIRKVVLLLRNISLLLFSFLLVRHYKSKKSVDFLFYPSSDTLFETISSTSNGNFVPFSASRCVIGRDTPANQDIITYCIFFKVVSHGTQTLDSYIGKTHFTHCDVWISGFSSVAPDQSPRPPRFFLRHEWRL